jgi:hypothetical protein
MKSRHQARLENILMDPAKSFAGPEDVLAAHGLTRDEKIRVLKLWEHDVAEAEVATEEGMRGNGDGLLRRILLALHELTGAEDPARTDPSKQHTLI